jgi:hypothetical protein
MHTLTSLSLTRTAMSLLSSLACRPMRPARSSSFSLRAHTLVPSMGGHAATYAHRVPRELVEHDDGLWFVERARDVLHEPPERLLLLRR